MNHFVTRAALVTGVLVAATLTGCSAGQQSQTATQEAAVNGASGGVGSLALRDVRIQAVQTGAEVPQGQSVDLLFVVANQSAADNDRLVGVTSAVGPVTVTPDNPEVPANRSLIVGKPESTDTEALQALTNSVKANATVKLNQPIRNGLTYDFVFKFEHAGQATVHVPVTAGEAAPRPESAAPTQEGH